MRKSDKKKNKRSLKRRILRMLSIINFNSLLIMLIALMLLFGATVSFFGEIVSKNISRQMSTDISLMSKRVAEDKRIAGNADKLTAEYTKLFRLLGERYMLFNRDDEILDNIENINLDISLDDQNMIKDIRLIEYEVLEDDKVIFSSMDYSVIGNVKFNKIMSLMSRQVERSFELEGNDADFKIRVRFNPFLILMGYASLIFVGIIIFFITHFIALVLTKTFSGMIVRPLNDLEFRLNQLAEGNIEVAMDTEIVLKKPIKEVESLASSTNKIISKMSEYVGLMESHKEELEAQNIALEESSATLTSMNAALANKHSKLINILNNVEQGFLTFGKDLYINNEYSLECERIFGESISENRLSDLLYPDDNNMKKFMDDLITKIFSSDKSQRKLYLSLLPEEVVIKDKNINITYKVVTNENNEEILMLILNDITEKRKLEKRMDEERNILKMVVKAIISRNEFLQLINDFKHFTEEDFSSLQETEFDEVLRNVHNFKGNFSQFDMINIVRSLNELENKLYENSSSFSVHSLNGNEMFSWINGDLEIIEAYVGKEFLREEETFYIRKSKLVEIEEKLTQVLSEQEYKTVLPIIKSLTYKPVKDLLRQYPAYVEKLSERLDKSIEPMEITGDDVLVDTNYYRDLSKSLVHIFRNCVDHGIESEDERLEKGKNQLGSIRCHVEVDDKNLSIIISDDGKGIDIDALEMKSLELGLYNADQISSMTRQQKLNLIFEQGISTKETATNISGRGVGMAAVKKCIEDMGGCIKVESEKDRYTRFIINVPKVENEMEKLVTASDFMEEMLKVTEGIICNQTNLVIRRGEVKERNVIELGKVTSLINLKGSINSIIMISVNEAMAIKLVEGFILEELNENEKREYAEDVLGEVCNNILGNTLGVFDDTCNIFNMGIPAMISNNGAYVKYTDSVILTASFECADCRLSISMLALQNEVEDALKGEVVWQEY